MSTSERLPADASLTVEQVAAMARVAPDEVLTAITNRRLRAEHRQGSWAVTVRDLRRWLSRR
jgi:hypothetical protein